MRYRGIGIANYVDTATGAPRDRAELSAVPEGFVEVRGPTARSALEKRFCFADSWEIL